MSIPNPTPHPFALLRQMDHVFLELDSDFFRIHRAVWLCVLLVPSAKEIELHVFLLRGNLMLRPGMFSHGH